MAEYDERAGHDGRAGHDQGYTGPATLTVDGRDVAVHAILDARHEPQDGRLHWFGRVVPAEPPGAELRGALTAPGSHVELRTDSGRARASVGDLDPWGRYRVTGVGALPYLQHDPGVST